jgi:hypothetical protein
MVMTGKDHSLFVYSGTMRRYEKRVPRDAHPHLKLPGPVQLLLEFGGRISPDEH